MNRNKLYETNQMKSECEKKKNSVKIVFENQNKSWVLCFIIIELNKNKK